MTSDPKKLSILPMGVQGLSQAQAPWEQLSETEGAQPVVMVTWWRQALGVSAPAVPVLRATVSSVFLPLPHIQQTCTVKAARGDFFLYIYKNKSVFSA